jgi:catechol 2,3-dioxygenase-like lactoylglutathione lyase family enzyme
MKLKLTSVTVNSQDEALKFYTEILGFKKVADINMGEYRWLTVSSVEEPNGVELVLEPRAFPPSVAYYKALFEAGIPANAFHVDDIEAEYQRLTALGVVFKNKPTNLGPVTLAMFDDTCGNYIQLAQAAG